MAREDRGLGIERVIGSVAPKLAALPEAVVFPFRPPPIQGLGNAGGFEMQVQDRSAKGYEALAEVARGVVAGAKEAPEIADAFTGFGASTPQLFLEIDHDRARRLGVPPADVFATLSATLGSFYVNDFNLLGRTYEVRVQGQAGFRRDPGDVLDLEVRNRAGHVVPLASVARVRQSAGPSTVRRHNLFPAASVNGEGVPAASTAAVLDRAAAVADEVLPEGFGRAWTGTAYQQRRAREVAPLVFALALVFVYLFLAAQYESWVLPVTIMATVPIGILGALLAAWARGLDNDVFMQIGLVLLVALVSKNAILIVEFAERRRREGRDLDDATVEAARIRLRPILMTTLAFVLGTVPLLVATGAGANGRRSIGTAVFGGMLLAVVVGVVFIPLLYALLRRVVPGRTHAEGGGNGEARDEAATAQSSSSSA